MNNNPLVSVIVITYNSASTIVETLDSIKEQTYNRIELIVTDDCSTDGTIKIVESWVKENGFKFERVDVLTSEKNTGVSGNVNRGICSSTGEWIKGVAGDDLLISTAIDEYVNYIRTNPDVRICVCDVEIFSAESRVPKEYIKMYDEFFKAEQEDFYQQKKRIKKELIFVGPTFFYSRDLFNEVGGFSNEYGCADEWPFVYKIINSGNRVYAIDKKLVCYRFSEKSISHTRENRFPQKLFMSTYKFYFDYPFRDLIREGNILDAWDGALLFWSSRLSYIIRNKQIGIIMTYIIRAASPLSYVKLIKKILN